LILPVVICLSQRLSHACLSVSTRIAKLRMAHYISYNLLDRGLHMDNCANCRANTCLKSRVRDAFIRSKPSRVKPVLMNHNNLANRMVFWPAMHHSNICPISFRW